MISAVKHEAFQKLIKSCDKNVTHFFLFDALMHSISLSHPFPHSLIDSNTLRQSQQFKLLEF